MSVCFSYLLPTRIEFGYGVSRRVGDEMNALAARNALVVCDEGVRSAGLVEDVLEDLGDAAVASTVFAEVSPNPRCEEVERIVEVANGEGCDVLVAVGGGSPMDAAKAAGLVLSNGGRIEDYEGWDRVTLPSRPVVTIPTTAGSGAEATYWAVITDVTRRFKFSVGSPLMAPSVALVDPGLTLCLPAWLTASTGVDVLTHAIESYTARVAQPITDYFAMAAIRLVAENLRVACRDGGNRRAREEMMLASCLAGITVGISSTAGVHCLSEALGATYDTPHGVANAFFLAAVSEYNLPAAPAKYARIAEALGLSRGSMSDAEAACYVPTKVRELISDIDIPLSEVVLEDRDLSHLARAATNNLACEANPRALTEADFLGILRMVKDRQAG